MQPDTGESSAAIERGSDDEEWPALRDALENGATLFRPAKLVCYYLDRSGEIGGGRLSPARIRKLEVSGVLRQVGVNRYALANQPDTDPENIYGSASMRQSIEEDRR